MDNKLTNQADYSKIAEDYFEQGYNCAQSVILTFAKEINLDKETALKLSSSFGGGMGRLREVCGAVSVMFMIAGILKGYTAPNDDVVKQKHYELIQELANTFKEQYGARIHLLNRQKEQMSITKKDHVSILSVFVQK